MPSEALINGLAGAGGGIVAQIITYPLQTVNTRQQTERDPSKSASRDGALTQMYQVVKHEGWGRLYGGLAPSLLGTAASQGIYYYFYQIFRSKAENAALDRWKKGIGDGSVGMFQSLVIAALSGCLNVLLTNPIWVVVTRMQTYKKLGKKPSTHVEPRLPNEANRPAIIERPSYGTSLAVQELYDEAGMWGFWKGVIPSLTLVSNPSIQFMLYETLIKNLKRKRGSNMKGAEGLTAIEIFFLGAFAKLGATIVTYPLVLLKSRLHVRQELDDKNHRYKGTLDAIAKIIRYEGVSGFYKGMGTKIFQSVFAAAVLLMAKEELVKIAHLLLAGELRGKINSKPKPP